MFEFEGNENLIVRIETIFCFFLTIYVLVKFDLIFLNWLYMIMAVAMFYFEADETENPVDYGDLRADYEDHILIPRPYNPDLVNDEDLFTIFEAGHETVIMGLDKTEDDKSLDKYEKDLKILTQPQINNPKDRFKFLLDQPLDQINNSSNTEPVNILQFKLVATANFTADELSLLNQKRKFLSFNQLQTDWFYYKQFVNSVNLFLFQTHVARGVYPVQQYDFKIFNKRITKSSDLEGCSLLSREANKNKINKS